MRREIRREIRAGKDRDRLCEVSGSVMERPEQGPDPYATGNCQGSGNWTSKRKFSERLNKKRIPSKTAESNLRLSLSEHDGSLGIHNQMHPLGSQYCTTKY